VSRQQGIQENEVAGSGPLICKLKCKQAVPTSQQTLCVSITKTSRLMLFRDISDAYEQTRNTLISDFRRDVD
jgi:hypothetical protein